MKTNFLRQSSLVAGLVLLLGCARPSAETQPRVVATPVPAPVIVAQAAPAPAQPAAQPTPAPNGVAVAAGTNAVADTNAPAIIERIPPAAKPEGMALSPGLTEVVKLAQSGVGEEVILAYVEKYSGSFAVGADQILYLNDLGVSSTVITSMLKHDGSSAAAASTPALPPATFNAPTNQVYAQTPGAAVAPLVETTVAPPPTSTEVAYFYDSLSPYGSWVYLSGYGWCWQPTVAVTVADWRPYSDRGRWYWSDAGWYWNSDYSWGWAPFHYGRWYHHARCGWVWTPGLTWAPSWVSWRYSDGYCGWAPLPPEAHYRYGHGFSYYGHSVGIGFDFGLSVHHYSFVSVRNFCDYEPRRHHVSRDRVRDVYRNTTVVNNYIVGNNNTVINRGVGRETIAARAGANSIREVSVRERPVQNMARVQSERIDRVERRGNEAVVYRPELPKTAPQVRTATFASRERGQGMTTGVRANTTAQATPPTTVNRSPGGGAVVGGNTRTAPAQSGRAERSPEPARPTETPRATERRQSTTVRNEGGRSVTPQRETQTTPIRVPAPTQPQQPQRGSRSLFGDSGVNATAPQNNGVQRGVTSPAQNTAPQRNVVTPQPNRGGRATESATAPFVPRAQTQPSQSAPANRVYPQPSAPARQPQQFYGRVETGRQSAPAPAAPRAYEAPRSAPSHSAPPTSAPRYSAPSGGSSPPATVRSSSGGNGRSDSGRGGNERGR